MVNERLALPAAPTGARAGAATHKLPVSGHAELPELFAPSIAAVPGGERRAKYPEDFDDVGIPIPEQAPSWAHERSAGAFSPDPAGEFSWREQPNRTFDAVKVTKSSGSFYRRAGQRMCAALLTGALLGTFGLGWVGGSASYRLLAPSPASSPLKQRANATARADSKTDFGRDATPSVRKLSASIASKPEHVVALPSGVRNLPRLMPVPETRPMTIEGWTVRDVSGSTAALEGPDGTWRAARGDIVPGLGRVESIVRWGNYWVVSTSRGLIASD